VYDFNTNKNVNVNVFILTATCRDHTSKTAKICKRWYYSAISSTL